MGVHNNVHIPSESWPHWTWYAIEFGIVMAVSMLVSREVTDSIEGLSPHPAELGVLWNGGGHILGVVHTDPGLCAQEEDPGDPLLGA